MENIEVTSVCLCFSRLHPSHHLPISTWRIASERQRGPVASTPPGSCTVQVRAGCHQAPSKKKSRRRRRHEYGGRDEKGFCSLLTLIRPSPHIPYSSQPPQRMPAEQCPALFVIYLLRWQAWFSFFVLLFKNTSLQTNAYTAALSVALSHCCVLTSSCNNIHSKNGSPAWKMAQRKLHSIDVLSLCAAKILKKT